MREFIPVPAEAIARILEINSDIAYLLEYGIDLDVMEELEALNNRLETLINNLEREEQAS